MKENEITRREAVERVGALGAAGILLTTPSLATADHVNRPVAYTQNSGVDGMSSDDWKTFVGDRFDVTGLSYAKDKLFKKTTMKLAIVEDEKRDTDELRPAHIRQSGYSLVFKAPVGSNLDCRTHVIEHRKLGTCHFHLQRVHLGNDEVEIRENAKDNEAYEVVIN